MYKVGNANPTFGYYYLSPKAPLNSFTAFLPFRFSIYKAESRSKFLFSPFFLPPCDQIEFQSFPFLNLQRHPPANPTAHARFPPATVPCPPPFALFECHVNVPTCGETLFSWTVGRGRHANDINWISAVYWQRIRSAINQLNWKERTDWVETPEGD